MRSFWTLFWPILVSWLEQSDVTSHGPMPILSCKRENFFVGMSGLCAWDTRKSRSRPPMRWFRTLRSYQAKRACGVVLAFQKRWATMPAMPCGGRPSWGFRKWVCTPLHALLSCRCRKIRVCAFMFRLIGLLPLKQWCYPTYAVRLDLSH